MKSNTQLAGIYSAPVLKIQENIVDGADVCHALHISPRTLKTWRDNGTLPYHKIGKKIYYMIEDIRETINKSRMRGKVLEWRVNE